MLLVRENNYLILISVYPGKYVFKDQSDRFRGYTRGLTKDNPLIQLAPAVLYSYPA
ncbi:hypothetical protein [Aquimarina algiphila]|uniref:hypothetical protein n=1 Tax=Aquimarina algiphila TaxID=2047982 RepID=UPI0014322F15|nr:hypothetical protein [Aquimarina algiphila]